MTFEETINQWFEDKVLDGSPLYDMFWDALTVVEQQVEIACYVCSVDAEPDD